MDPRKKPFRCKYIFRAPVPAIKKLTHPDWAGYEHDYVMHVGICRRVEPRGLTFEAMDRIILSRNQQQ